MRLFFSSFNAFTLFNDSFKFTRDAHKWFDLATAAATAPSLAAASSRVIALSLAAASLLVASSLVTAAASSLALFLLS